jgi:acyl-CoA reductase-like NAD-dependent aldehyde dehydrogenase
VCEDSNVFIARRIVFALVLAAFRMWRRMPPEERKRVLNALRTHGTRAASSLKQRTRG